MTRPFAIYTKGELYYLGLHEDEASCWKVALGWPSEQEIQHFIAAQVAMCVPVRVDPVAHKDRSSALKAAWEREGLLKGPFI